MNTSLLEHYTELVRSEFERLDYWEASNLIDRVREMGIHELDELCDEMHNDLKFQQGYDREKNDAFKSTISQDNPFKP